MTDLFTKLEKLGAEGKPARVGLIGAGKFGSMFLSSVYRTPGMHLVGIADLDPNRPKLSLERVGFPKDKYGEFSFEEAHKTGATALTTSSKDLIASPYVDIIIEATGNPGAGVNHALQCFANKKHIIMVNVEADVLCGPLLARKAKEAGVIFSMAYGDQPALIAEMISWARSCGFTVVCAGKGTKHLPEYHYSNPDTVWGYYGFTKEQLATGDFNPRMFNSFLDGTKSALEAAAVANGADLTPPADGLKFPPMSVYQLAEGLIPKGKGGVLDEEGTVEVVSCLNLDASWVENHLRWGVYVVIKANNEYQRDCFAQYGLKTDASGWYAAQFKPYHLIGLELGISVASIAVRGEPTGTTRFWQGDVVATAKKDLKAGEMLDGEGGYTVYGKLRKAKDSVKLKGIPIGLAHGVKLTRDVKKDEPVSWDSVETMSGNVAYETRREMERVFGAEWGLA